MLKSELYSPFEFRFLTKDGSFRWAMGVFTPFQYEGGRGTLGYYMDITQTKQLEERHRAQTAELKAIQDSVATGLLLLDKNMNVLWANDTYAEMIDLHPEDMVGKNWYEVCAPGEKFRDLHERALNGEEIDLQDSRIDFPEGNRYFDVRFRPVRDGKKTLVTIENTTERKRLQEQLLQAQKMEAVGTLAWGVAHDFNNLLTVILGYAEMLLGKLPSDSPIRDNLEEIFRSGERGKALSDQLLTFSRKQPSEMQVLDLNDSIERTVNMLPRVIRENIRVTFMPEPDLGQVRADANQIEQVLLNLALNARDAMPKGGRLNIKTGNVMLDDEYAHTHLEVEPGPHVLLTVTDNGKGMDEETRKRIFEPFFTSKDVGKGTGLGLSVVQGIVKQHGGHIWVYSEPGLGTTFKIYFPRVDAPVEQLPVEPKQLGVAPGAKTIVVAEDEEGVRDLLKSVLEEEGYQLLSAVDADEAEKVFQEHASEISLLVSDVVMLGGNGPELYERLAKENPGLKVLFLSGYSDQDVLQNLILDPHMPFLRKPFSPKVLVQKVQELLKS